MDKKTMRVVSRIGLLLVIIGFFMPISCNMNGFQLANSLETLSGTTLLSLSLYVVFIFSCFGIILPIVYFFIKKPYSIKNDWVTIITIIISFTFFILSCIGNESNSIFRLQSGAYIIIIGLLLSLICLFFYSFSINNNMNINIQTNYKNNFCKHCGNRLQENANFCKNCGSKI